MIHDKFILYPITEILKNTVSACSSIGDGIETYPLSEYILKSTFLEMTGFQEQKINCIIWELASNDYEYRYDTDKGFKKHFMNYSSYDQKDNIYQKLLELNKTYDAKYVFEFNKSERLLAIITDLRGLLKNTNLSIWKQSTYDNCLIIINDCFRQTHALQQLNPDTLIASGKDNPIRIMYNKLFNYRNACAHNLQSYQENLPTLDTLADNSYKYENYFIRFAILILIDEIFVKLYHNYRDLLKNKIL